MSVSISRPVSDRFWKVFPKPEEEGSLWLQSQGLLNFYSMSQGRSIVSHEKSLLFEWWNLSQIQQDCYQKLKAKFLQNKVKMRPLKGIFFKEDELFPSSYCRPMTDIDLVVMREEESRSRQLMNELGYEFVEGDTKKAIFHLNSCQRLIVVELHFGLWVNGRCLSQGEEDLSLEEHLLFLIYHYLVQHSGLRLVWLVDILYFLKKYQQNLNREEFERLVERYRLKRACSLFFSFLKETFGDHAGLYDQSRGFLFSYFSLKKFLQNPRKNLFSFLYFKIFIRDDILLSLLNLLKSLSIRVFRVDKREGHK